MTYNVKDELSRDPIYDPELPIMLEDARRMLTNSGYAVHANAVLNANMALTRMKELEATQPNWQPIETAPRDGKLVQTAEFYGDKWNLRNLNWVEAEGEYLAGWACPDQGYTGFNFPTKWMPLPKAPDPKSGDPS